MSEVSIVNYEIVAVEGSNAGGICAKCGYYDSSIPHTELECFMNKGRVPECAKEIVRKVRSTPHPGAGSICRAGNTVGRFPINQRSYPLNFGLDLSKVFAMGYQKECVYFLELRLGEN